MKAFSIFLFLFVAYVTSIGQSVSLKQFLESQHCISSFELISGNRFFQRTYQINFRQALDHADTTRGFFNQRVFVAEKDIENPVLLITEGYAANYAKHANYINELSPMLNSNQICIEHRYFGESWPDSLNWEFLTVKNAAADHHKIVDVFKKYYKGKWINTGISKGGQTAVYHRTYYPNDVDATVAYVCPLNFGIEDGRHEPFLRKVPGTAEQRKKIEGFQLAILKNREVILPKLEKFVKQKDYNFRISLNEVLDYCVLEYPFALWQWGKLTDKIPTDNANANELFKHLMDFSDLSYFAIEGMNDIRAFFVQAARELGYYGYDIKPFKRYLSIKTSKNYLEKIFLPHNLQIGYDKKTARQVKRFMCKTSENILFVYGEFDPWSASGFRIRKKPNLVKIVKPEGSHFTRIKNLPQNQKGQVKYALEDWLNIPVQIN